VNFAGEEDRDDELAPNMTPMIDVVFLLIVFFLVAAQLSVGSDEDVELPVASEARRIRDLSPDTITIEMKRAPEGAAFVVSGKPYTFVTLMNRLRAVVELAKFRGAPAPPVMLRADHRVPWREVQKLMFACAGLGIHRFDFQAAPSEETWR
jgi:biopolymer transport protein ExbD